MSFVRTADDLLTLLDDLLPGQDGERWDAFFADRSTPCPFFVDVPDENLVEWFDTGRFTWAACWSWAAATAATPCTSRELVRLASTGSTFGEDVLSVLLAPRDPG